MLGLNVEALAKAEVEKLAAKLKAVDADHDGLADVAEAEKLLSEGVATLKGLEAKVSPQEIAAALDVLFPGKFNAAEIAAGEAAVNKLMDGFNHLKGVAAAAGIKV